MDSPIFSFHSKHFILWFSTKLYSTVEYIFKNKNISNEWKRKTLFHIALYYLCDPFYYEWLAYFKFPQMNKFLKKNTKKLIKFVFKKVSKKPRHNVKPNKIKNPHLLKRSTIHSAFTFFLSPSFISIDDALKACHGQYKLSVIDSLFECVDAFLNLIVKSR